MKNLTDRRSFLKDSLYTSVVAPFIPGFKNMDNNLVNLEKSENAFLPSLLRNSDGSEISTLVEWKKRRKSIKNRWLTYLNELPDNTSPADFYILSEKQIEDLIIQKIEYEGEPGFRVQAYLIKPNFITKPLPGIVAFHSTSDEQMRFISGIETGNIIPFGFRMAKHGFVVICPQCFLWINHGHGDEEISVAEFRQQHPKSKGMAKMLFDGKRAVDVLERLCYVDPNRIGTLGHSLGAKEALYLAAFDNRVKVAVSNEGGVGIELSNWDAPWYLGNEIHRFKHEHHEVLSLVAPNPFLLIGGEFDNEKSREYIKAVFPVYQLYGDKKQNIEFYNHAQGHHPTPFSEKLTYEWIIDHMF